jgi:hypothetical protein
VIDPIKEPAPAAEGWRMHEGTRLAADTELTVDRVVALSGRDRHAVLAAIEHRKLRARQSRGEWIVTVADMRRWLSRS